MTMVVSGCKKSGQNVSPQTLREDLQSSCSSRALNIGVSETEGCSSNFYLQYK